MGMKRDKKDDEDNGGVGGGHPYSNLEKTSVLQEARYQPLFVFNIHISFSINSQVFSKSYVIYWLHFGCKFFCNLTYQSKIF